MPGRCQTSKGKMARRDVKILSPFVQPRRRHDLPRTISSPKLAEMAAFARLGRRLFSSAPAEVRVCDLSAALPPHGSISLRRSWSTLHYTSCMSSSAGRSVRPPVRDSVPVKILVSSLIAGAQMVPFAGYALPVQYPDGVLSSHLRTRQAGCASLFDVGHMGQIRWRGRDRAVITL